MIMWTGNTVAPDCEGYMGKLEEAFYAMQSPDNNKDVIHITHTDLDGYGCGVISDVISATYRIENRTDNGTFTRVHTNELNDKVYRVITDQVNVAVCSNENRRIVVFVTDIGGVHLGRIVKDLGTKYRNRITLVVMDHHVNPNYDDAFKGMVKDQPAYIGDDAIYFIGEHHKNATGIYMSCRNVSATYLMFYMFSKMCGKQYTPEYLIRMEEIAGIISRYDTGNFGNWVVDDEAILNSPEITDGVKDLIFNAVSQETTLNSALYMYKDKDLNNPDSNSVQDTFINTLSCYIRGITNDYDRIVYNNELAMRLIDMNKQYIEFKNLLKSDFSVCDTTVLFGTDVYSETERHDLSLDVTGILSPVHMDLLYIQDSKINDVKDKYPFFIFAKEYMREAGLKRPLIVRISYIMDKYDTTSVKKCVYSLCSNGYVDCARLARLNGGGGHMNAAGFTMYER